MGNHPSKQEAQASPQRRPVPLNGEAGGPSSLSSAPPPPSYTPERPTGQRRRSSRHDLGIFSIGGGGGRQDAADPASPEARRETKPEREARRLERERAQRAIDRERSIREEHVDGGFLVTLGTYTGTEDFSKPIVRRLQIERRLAPFWKGLQDHEDDWKDNQLVAVVKGQPLPEPEDNIVQDRPPRADQSSSYADMTPDSSNTNIISQSITISASPDSPYNMTPNLSPSHPAFSTSFPSGSNMISTSPSEQATHKNPLLRGRAKTLASLASLSRHSTQEMLAPQEKQLPHDPYYNSIPLEAVLYRNASECPICFLYYPPYLNRTRCCDQPICSECFVQIKRPDPHPPEHADPVTNASVPAPPPADPSNPLAATEYQLVSEPATCPFCKTPELGVTYEAPPFRRGLSYGNTLSALRSAMSSASSISSQGGIGHSRRRNLSISADAPNVITTDQVRPDWSKKLSDARAQALRRAAAATALHNAAYMMNIGEGSDSRLPFGGRRRRTLFSGPPDHGPMAFGPMTGLLARDSSQQSSDAAENGRADHVPGRISSRRRIEDIEQMMMEEAIRQSIAMEEERKRKDEKDAAKQSKKEEKQKAKEGKKSWREFRRSSATDGESSSAAGKRKSVEHDSSTIVAGSAPTASFLNVSAALNALPQGLTPGAATGTPSTSTPSPALPLREPPPVPIAMSRSHSNASSLHDPQQPPSPFTFGPNGSGISLEGSPFSSDTPPGSTTGQAATGSEQVFGFRSLDEVIGDDASSPNSPTIGNVGTGAADLPAPSSAPHVSNDVPELASSPQKSSAMHVNAAERPGSSDAPLQQQV